jgi:putative ABC transport system substrate-binding protein
MDLRRTSRRSLRSLEMPRRVFMAVFTGGLLAAPLAAEAQSGAGKVPRVGLLGATSEAGYARQVRALRQGFRDLGYIEGRSIVIEYRWAQGQYDRLPALAAELIRLQPDVIVTSGPGIRVMKEATATIPIVMAVGGDVVASGLVASLARPGGNITGSTFFGPELSAKRLELLKEAVPRLARVAVVLNPSGDYHVDLERVKKTAAALNVDLLETPARAPREFREALARAVRQRADGITCLSDSMLVANMRHLGGLSAAKGLPGAGSDEFAEGGGLLAYGVSFPELWRRASYFVDKILKGGNPATIPVEQASKFELVVNLKTAKALGLTIPPSLLQRADQVIE